MTLLQKFNAAMKAVVDADDATLQKLFRTMTRLELEELALNASTLRVMAADAAAERERLAVRPGAEEVESSPFHQAAQLSGVLVFDPPQPIQNPEVQGFMRGIPTKAPYGDRA